MKDGLRFVDCDMHVMEPPDLFDRYLDPAFRSRGRVCSGGLTASRVRGMVVIDDQPTTIDHELQQHRKRTLPPPSLQTTQPLSGSRMADSGQLDFAVERDYDPEAQVMGMALEGIDIAVLYPTAGLSYLARDGMDPRLSLAICQAYNHWIHEFTRYSPERMKWVAMLPLHDVNLACAELVRCVTELGAVGSFVRPNRINGHFWHSNYWNSLFALHEELGVTMGFHEGTGAPYSHMNVLYGENRFYRHVASHWIEMQQALIRNVDRGRLRVLSEAASRLSRSAELLGSRDSDSNRMGLSPVSRLARALPLADTEGVLSAQLLGRSRRQRAGNRSHRRSDRCRPNVHLDVIIRISTRTFRTCRPICFRTPSARRRRKS